MLTSTFTDFVNKYMILRLILGFNVDFGGSKRILALSSCYCVTALLLNFYFLIEIIVFIENIKLSNHSNSLEFLVNCISGLIFKSQYVKKYKILLATTSEVLQTKTMAVPWKISILHFFNFCWSIISFALGTKMVFPSLCYFLGLALIISSYVNYNSKIFFLNVIYNQISCLRQKFDIQYNVVDNIGNDRRIYNINTIKNCLVVYDRLVTSVEEMDHEIEIWLLTLVLSEFPKCVIFMYYGTFNIIKQGVLGSHIKYLGLFTVTMSHVATPMIMFELIKKEVEIIKKNLFRQMLNCRDEVLEEEIQRALDYLNLRPFEHKIWRMIPMGVSLPLTFLSLCITYVIVLAQYKQA